MEVLVPIVAHYGDYDIVVYNGDRYLADPKTLILDRDTGKFFIDQALLTADLKLTVADEREMK